MNPFSRFIPHISESESYRLALAMSSTALVVGYIWLSLARVTYPYALDLVEEGMVQQAWRVARGMPVFVPPNAEFVPQVYMPLYTWIGGQLLRLTSFDFWPLRGISSIATILSAALLSWIGWQVTRDKLTALATAGLFLSGYRLVGGWYDLARVDPLFLFLSLAGMAAAVYGHRHRSKVALTGMLIGLSILTKQNGLLYAAWLGIYLLFVAKGRVWLYVVTLLVTLLPVAIMELSTRGWFSYYVIDIAYASPVSIHRLWRTVTHELMGGMGFLVLATGVVVASNLRANGCRISRSEPWLPLILAAVIVSLSGRASVGGNLNNLIPGYALLCLSPALLQRTFFQMPHPCRRGRQIVGVLVLGQMLLALLTPFPTLPQRYLPTSEMREAGDALLARVREADGEVVVLMHPSYAIRAGMSEHMHIQSLWHARHRGLDALPPDFVMRIEGQKYALVISDDSQFFERDPALVHLLNASYRVAGYLGDEESPPTLNGPVVRPLVVHLPKDTE